MSNTNAYSMQNEELEEIENLIKQEKKVNTKWYLIPASWYKDFLEYCEDTATNIMPEPIDTSLLLVNDKVTLDKKMIQLVPEEAYTKLVAKYKLKSGCKPYFRYATYTTDEKTEVDVELNVNLYSVIIKKDHKMGRVNRDIQIKYGSEENEIKNQLKIQLDLTDVNFKLLYRRSRLEEFIAIDGFISNEDNNEIKEILVLYERSKEEEEEFINTFNKSGRIDGEYYDIRITDSFWVQGKVTKFGNYSLFYDLFCINKSQDNNIWSNEYDKVIRPLNYYTPNFRDFKKGDVILKKSINEFHTIIVSEVDLKANKIKFLNRESQFVTEDIDSGTLFDYETYKIVKDKKDHSTTSIRPSTDSTTRNRITNTSSSSSSSSSSSTHYATHNYYNSYSSKPSAPGVVGLSNLGNTCFMDSMLQCMSNCQPLTEYFLSGDYVNDINETNPIGTKGELARSYANFLDNLWQGHSSVFTPSDFKHTIGRHAPRFAGYEQQDSSELMNYLLDGLHEDLNKIKKKPYIEGVNVEGKSLVEIADEYWKVHLARNTSKIVDIFCGQLRSHLVCPNCNNASDIFDPYYSLSLPIPDSITYKMDALYYNDINKPPLRLTLVSNNDEIEDFELALRNQLNIPPSDKLLNIDYTKGEIDGKIRSYLYRYSSNPLCYFNVTAITRKFQEFYSTLDPSIVADSNVMMNDDITESNNNNNNNNGSSDSDSSFNNFNNHSYNHNHNHNNSETGKYTFVNFQLGNDDYMNNRHKRFYYPQMYPIENSNRNENLIKRLINEYVEEKDISEYISDNYFRNKYTVMLKDSISADVAKKLDEVVDDESYLKNRKTEKKEISLNDCIDLLLREEVLGDDDKWHCPKCKEFVRATKKFYVWSLPEILIIHLKRFSIKMDKRFSKYGFGSREKLDTLVIYPEHIDLSQYVDGPNKGNCNYSLYAVSEHSGSLSFGHYTATCKNFKNGNWYYFNDSSVSKSNGPHPSSCDYVLFYQRDRV